jgi:hypothetical protein
LAALRGAAGPGAGQPAGSTQQKLMFYTDVSACMSVFGHDCASLLINLLTIAQRVSHTIRHCRQAALNALHQVNAIEKSIVIDLPKQISGCYKCVL